MAKINWVTIAVSEETRAKATFMKKNRTMDELVSSMMRYFEYTNYDPFALHKNPTMDFYSDFSKDIERLIKIIKAQEKDIFKPMYEILKDVSIGKNLSTQTEKTNEVSLDELQLIVENNQNLEENIKELEAKIEKLQRENTNLKINSNSDNSSSIDKEVIHQAAKAIMDNCKSNRFEEGQLSIPRKTLESYLKRITDQLDK